MAHSVWTGGSRYTGQAALPHKNIHYGVFGVWGVQIFFVLSGFLMAYNYMPKDNAPESSIEFMWNKIKKLFPLHIVTMLASAMWVLVSIIHGDSSWFKLFRDIILNTLLLQIWIPIEELWGSLNGPSWFLCAIAFCYLLFPRILQFIKSKSKKKLIQFIYMGFLFHILVSIIAYMVGDGYLALFSQWFTYYCPLTRSIDFTMGCFLGALFLQHEKDEHKPIYPYTIGEVVIIVAILAECYIFKNRIPVLGSEYVKYALLFSPSTVALIWLLAMGRGKISKLISTKFFVFIGDISPYTFLIHKVSLDYCDWIMWRYFSDFANNYNVALVAFIVTIIMAIVWKKVMKIV